MGCLTPPLALIYFMNPACAPVTPTTLLYYPLLVPFSHLGEHNQAFREYCRRRNSSLTVDEVVPLPACWALPLPWRHLNTKRVYFALYVGPDGTCPAFCFFLLLTAVHCCKYAVSVPDVYLGFLGNPFAEGFTICDVWVLYQVMKPSVLR